MARRVRTMPVLAAAGIIQEGTELEVIPEALPRNAEQLDPRLFRARVVKPSGLNESVIWEFDGQPYFLSELTTELWEHYGVAHLRHYTFIHWRIVGRTESLWDEAERFPR